MPLAVPLVLMSSRAVSKLAMLRSASKMLLRCTSVGCAVNTGETWLLAKRLRNGFGRDARPAQARQSHIDAAFLRVTGTLVNGATANMVAVFSQISQMAEVGEGTNHAHGLVGRAGL